MVRNIKQKDGKGFQMKNILVLAISVFILSCSSQQSGQQSLSKGENKEMDLFAAASQGMQTVHQKRLENHDTQVKLQRIQKESVFICQFIKKTMVEKTEQERMNLYSKMPEHPEVIETMLQMQVDIVYEACSCSAEKYIATLHAGDIDDIIASENQILRSNIRDGLDDCKFESMRAAGMYDMIKGSFQKLCYLENDIASLRLENVPSEFHLAVIDQLDLNELMEKYPEKKERCGCLSESISRTADEDLFKGYFIQNEEKRNLERYTASGVPLSPKEFFKSHLSNMQRKCSTPNHEGRHIVKKSPLHRYTGNYDNGSSPIFKYCVHPELILSEEEYQQGVYADVYIILSEDGSVYRANVNGVDPYVGTRLLAAIWEWKFSPGKLNGKENGGTVSFVASYTKKDGEYVHQLCPDAFN